MSYSMKCYYAVGEFLRDYRALYSLSQENFSEQIDVNLKTFQRYERNEHPIPPHILIKIAKKTFLSTHILKSLNTGLPIFCSIRKRIWASTQVEMNSFFYIDDLAPQPPKDESPTMRFAELMDTEFIHDLITSHLINLPGYGLSQIETVRRAAQMVPEMNFIVYDEFNVPIGHQICLPLSPHTYSMLKSGQITEQMLRPENLFDVPVIKIGAFFCTAEFAACRAVQHNIVLRIMRYLSTYGNNNKLLLSVQIMVPEGHEIVEKIGLKLVLENQRQHMVSDLTDRSPAIYETDIKTLMDNLMKLQVRKFNL